MKDPALHEELAAGLASETDVTVRGDHYDALCRALVVRGFLRVSRVVFTVDTQRRAERYLRDNLVAVAMHQMHPHEMTSLEFEWLPADEAQQDNIPDYAALDAALLAKFGNSLPEEPAAAIDELLCYAYKRILLWSPTSTHKRYIRACWLQRAEQLLPGKTRPRK